MKIRGLVTCVDYDDLLAITLPRNMRHMSECLVVTSRDDHRTKGLVSRLGESGETGDRRVSWYETDAFYGEDASFNKGAAVEQALDHMGREGWVLIWDADTLFPVRELDGPSIARLKLDPQCLYSAHRRVLRDPREWREGFRFQDAQPTFDAVHAGYFQLFHAECSWLTGGPWYDHGYTHAGGCDEAFCNRFPPEYRVWLPFEVLHLGPRDTNWCGRLNERLDGDTISPRLGRSQEDMLSFLSSRSSPSLRTVRKFRERL